MLHLFFLRVVFWSVSKKPFAGISASAVLTDAVFVCLTAGIKTVFFRFRRGVIVSGFRAGHAKSYVIILSESGISYNGSVLLPKSKLQFFQPCTTLSG